MPRFYRAFRIRPEEDALQFDRLNSTSPSSKEAEEADRSAFSSRALGPAGCGGYRRNLEATGVAASLEGLVGRVGSGDAAASECSTLWLDPSNDMAGLRFEWRALFE